MRLDGQEESENVEDRRSMSPRGMVVGGGVGTIVLALIVWFLGGDPMQLFQQQPGQPGQPGQVGQPLQPGGGNGGGAVPQQEELTHFVKVVLRDTEVVWDDLFRQQQRTYRYPKLVLFNGAVDSACGLTSSAVGPFYCPEDEKVYLDLSFYRDLKTRFGAPGDFAQAYVIAHEVGHHVQKLLGISDRVAAARRGASRAEANQLSVCLELQADFFAGVWANHAQQRFKFLDPGDIEDALRCANAIGDDRLQLQARGTVVPDSFTHGSSAQRMRWFKRGWTTGDMTQGDTFNAKEL
ncbi:MAG TPA: neutral zinc metallopeptidase [Pirellulales bacterium]|nr:neutral zinc metallopeptidase [Pirellulales bacterium]